MRIYCYIACSMMLIVSCGSKDYGIYPQSEENRVDYRNYAEKQIAYAEMFDFEDSRSAVPLASGPSIFGTPAEDAMRTLWNSVYTEVSESFERQLDQQSYFLAYKDYLIRRKEVDLFKKNIAYSILLDTLNANQVTQFNVGKEFISRLRQSIDYEDHTFRYIRFGDIRRLKSITYGVQYYNLTSSTDSILLSTAVSNAINDWNEYLLIPFEEIQGDNYHLVIYVDEDDSDISTSNSDANINICAEGDKKNYANATVVFNKDEINQIQIFPSFFDPNNKFDRAGILRHELGHILGLLHTCHNLEAPGDIECGGFNPDDGVYDIMTGHHYNSESVMKSLDECCFYNDFALKIHPRYDGEYIYKALAPIAVE